jgi:hypothetical protein
MEYHQSDVLRPVANVNVAPGEAQTNEAAPDVSVPVSAVPGVPTVNCDGSNFIEGPHVLYATEHVIPVDEKYCGPKTYAVAGLLSVLCLLPCAACLPFYPCDTRRINKRRYLIR